MDLNNKIKQILADKNISPSIFADEIGIQRSSMSHILAGRNKPSLDIVQKIIRRYPELGTKWILDDEDLPAISTDASGAERFGNDHATHPTKTSLQTTSRPTVKPDLNGKGKLGNQSLDGPSQTQNRRVEKILIFYTDGTFEEVKSI